MNNFTSTLPSPQSDLANYLLKDPYIFDLAGAKEKVDEKDIEEQLVKHVTRYLLEMGNGFAFVARQKHFQVGNSDFFERVVESVFLHLLPYMHLVYGFLSLSRKEVSSSSTSSILGRADFKFSGMALLT